MLREEFLAHRLHADVPDGEINRRLLEIYREAKLSIEENGANTLYLALGFLAWYETGTSPTGRVAEFTATGYRNGLYQWWLGS